MRRFLNKKIFVDLKYQLWIGLEVAFIGLVFWLIALLLFCSPLTSFSLENEEATEWVLDAMLRIVMIQWPLIAVAFALTWFIGIIMAHRIVGPMVRVRMVLNDWEKGEYETRFKFRKYDYILPIMGPLNRLLDDQEKVIHEAEALVEEIQKTSGDPYVLEKTNALLKVLYKKKNDGLS